MAITTDNQVGLRARLRQVPIVIGLATALHAIAGIVLLIADTQVLPTPIGDLRELLTQPQIGTLLLIAAIVGAAGTVARRQAVTLLCWAPQQFILTFMALSSSRAVLAGHYADGVARPWEFILVDQLPTILLAAFYAGAMVRWGRHE